MNTGALQHQLAEAYRGELDVKDALGVGGFGAVFRAHDPVLQRDVAIKVLTTSTAAGSDARERFLSEARTLATVEHPHIVPLYAVEVRDDLLCLTMRLVPGQSLADRMTTASRLAPATAVRLAREVAEALATAHARGIVHRDIKPENVLLDESDHAIVTDFGISLVTGGTDNAPATSSGTESVGTPLYMSPEQALGESVDGRADVYSLGVMLYAMLSGRLPFEATTSAGLLAKHLLDAPAPLAELDPELPQALVEATELAMQKSPSARPTAEAFAQLLARASTSEALRSPSAVRRAQRRRRIRLLSLVGVTAVIVLAFAYQGMMLLIRGFASGAIPALSATGPSIPEGLVAEALEDGSLLAGERVRYAFVPDGLDWEHALLITDSLIIRRSPEGHRRLRGEDASIQLFYNAGSGTRGVFVQEPGSTVPDTLYNTLSGAELGLLNRAFSTLAP